MEIKFWGTRGSLPAFGSDAHAFGGNTSCVSVHQDETLLILDAGSGLRRLGSSINESSIQNIHILLTHLHFDHIQGLGFFKPFFNPESEVHIWGPPSSKSTLADRLKRYLSPPLFPIQLRDFPCKIHLHEIPVGPFDILPFSIEAAYVCHPGPTVGYRIERNGAVLTYIPDHEPALGVKNFPISAEWTSGYSLAKDADILIHDGQFTNEEYVGRVGWGHSSIEHTLKFAEICRAKRLLIFHHDPGRTDEEIQRFYKDYVESGTYPFKVEFAWEDQLIEI